MPKFGCELCGTMVEHRRRTPDDEYLACEVCWSEYSASYVPESRYGLCPDCGAPLENWGAASDGDGDIYDEIGCSQCEEIKEKWHATYCRCPECVPYAFDDEDDWGW